MLISLGLYSIAVVGVFLVARKYGLSAAPLEYHKVASLSGTGGCV